MDAQPSSATSLRGATLVAMPIAIVLLFASYYGARTLVPVWVPDSDRADLFETMSWALTAGLALSGVAAIAIRPWAMVAAGGVVAAIGTAMLAIGPEHAALGAVVLVVGQSLARPAIYGVAAAPFGREHAEVRHALFFGMLLAMDLGGFAGPLLSGTLRTAGFELAFFALAAVALLSTIPAVSLAILAHRRGLPPSARRQSRTKLLLAVLALILLVRAPSVFAQASLDVQEPWAMIARGLGSWLAVLVGVALFAVLHARKARAPVWILIAAGLALSAFGDALAMMFPSSVPLWIGRALGGAGESVVAALLLSRLLAEVSPRLVTLVAAGWSLSASGAAWLGALAEVQGDIAMAWTGVAATLLVGAAIALGQRALERVFDPPEDREAPTTF